MAEIEFNGFEELQNQFDNSEKATNELKNTDEIALSELFADSFMKENTDFSTLDEMFEAFGYGGFTQSEFDNIPDKEIDRKVSESTAFNSWREMLDKAAKLYVLRKLGF